MIEMCGRYLFDPLTGEIDEYWQIIANVAKKQEKYRQQEVATGEIFPSNMVLALGANKEGLIVPGFISWGFTGYRKGQLLINAKSETVEEKKTFSSPFKENRCVFPANGFYEWDSNKHKFFFTNDQVIYIAGFYRIHQSESGKKVESIIMTTSPNKTVSKIHDRMPVIVNKKDITAYISDLYFARNLINSKMPELTSRLVS